MLVTAFEFLESNKNMFSVFLCSSTNMIATPSLFNDVFWISSLMNESIAEKREKKWTENSDYSLFEYFSAPSHFCLVAEEI